jgi:hypothetical protein
MYGSTSSGTPAAIVPGMTVIFEPYTTNQENVVVKAPVTASQFLADFQRPHAQNATIMLTSTGDRSQGKVNINNIWDFETFSALCDAVAGSNNFTPNDVHNIYTALVASRSRMGYPQATIGDAANATDVPFLGAATGTYQGGSQYANYGINNSLFRASGAKRLFETTPAGANPNTTPPYIKYQLLDKIANNITTRSNVFAVWITVGFFQVLNTGNPAQPQILGAEVGASSNQNVRHRMFAIVDRSNLMTLANQATRRVFNPLGVPNYGIPVTATTLTTPVPGAGPQLVGVGALQGTWTLEPPNPPLTWSWNITAGTALAPQSRTVVTIDRGNPNEETVVVNATPTATSFHATFTQPHAVGAIVTLFLIPGNPGPQANFDPTQNTAVVPYTSIIH